MTTSDAGAARRPGLITLAAILMLAVGFARIISGINYLAGGDQVSDLSHSLYGGNLWVWGIWDLGIAALAILAGTSLLSGGSFGRFVGYVWAVVLIVQSIAIIGVAPWYAAVAILLGVLVIHGLSSTADWAEGS